MDEPQNNYAELRKPNNRSKLQESIYINFRDPKLINMNRQQWLFGEETREEERSDYKDA